MPRELPRFCTGERVWHEERKAYFVVHKHNEIYPDTVYAYTQDGNMVELYAYYLTSIKGESKS